MVLYLAQAILLALGAAVVVFALRQRREQVPGASRDEAVAALYRQRLTELRGELTAGRVAEVDRAQIEEELGAALLGGDERAGHTRKLELEDRDVDRCASSIDHPHDVELHSVGVELDRGGEAELDLAAAGRVTRRLGAR